MSITLIVALSTFGVILLIFFTVIFFLIYGRKIKERDAQLLAQKNDYERQLLNAVLEIAEDERVKIARNLHDDLGMTLHTVQNNVRLARKKLAGQELVSEVLHTTDQIIADAHAAIRSIARDLNPAPLVEYGIVGGFQHLTDEINTFNIIRANFLNSSEITIDLSQRISVHVYLMAKEIANNIIKHALASELNLCLTESVTGLKISIQHNGKGISNETAVALSKSANGVGLRSILGRAQLINAKVQYSVHTPVNSEIIIQVPVE